MIHAAEMGVSFPLKKRDILLAYVLTLMGRDETYDIADSSVELLYTQVLCNFLLFGEISGKSYILNCIIGGLNT